MIFPSKRAVGRLIFSCSKNEDKTSSERDLLPKNVNAEQLSLLPSSKRLLLISPFSSERETVNLSSIRHEGDKRSFISN